MSILLKKAGILTTIQDLGRYGYRRFGINPGGAMDRTAIRLTNLLLGNRESDAVLEMHFPAAEIEFEARCRFAIGGADLLAELDGHEIDNWRTYNAENGSILRFAEKRLGNRVYLAVEGGFDVPEWLGSHATNLAAGIGGFDGRRLSNGNRLPFVTHSFATRPPERVRRVSPSLIPLYSSFPTLRVIPGAEFALMDESSRTAFETQTFGLSRNSDRMGFRLKSDSLRLQTPIEPIEMVSSAVSFGTIQLLPDGQLILLMADHQTSGGYPRIAHVIEHDLPVAGQLGGHDKVGFHIVSPVDAESLNNAFEHDMTLFRTGCQLGR